MIDRNATGCLGYESGGLNRFTKPERVLSVVAERREASRVEFSQLPEFVMRHRHDGATSGERGPGDYEMHGGRRYWWTLARVRANAHDALAPHRPIHPRPVG